VRRRVRGVQPGDVDAQLADLGYQGLGLSHSSSISGPTPMATTPDGSTHEATPQSDNRRQHQASDDQGGSAVGSPNAQVRASVAGAIIGGALTGFLLAGVFQALTAKYAPPPPFPTPICYQIETCSQVATDLKLLTIPPRAR
jgi:hypothetical protein